MPLAQLPIATAKGNAHDPPTATRITLVLRVLLALLLTILSADHVLVMPQRTTRKHHVSATKNVKVWMNIATLLAVSTLSTKTHQKNYIKKQQQRQMQYW